jgi:hypothetical protein
MDAPIARRAFLRLAGTSAGLVALSRLRLVVPAAGAIEEGAALRVLGPSDARILGAVAERIVFTGDPEMPRFADTAGLATIDVALLHVPETVRTQLYWALRIFEYGPPAFTWRLSRFTALDAAAQDDYLRAWSESRFVTCRLAFQALKNLSFLGYYSQDATWKGIHYDGPWAPRPRRQVEA